jgi:threonine dehydrogenase-like Zn-dependent dehydrogenase
MKAGLYMGTLKAEIHEIDKPEPGPKDVLVKTVRASICGSDLGGVGVEEGKEFGHEAAGYIAEMGKDVKNFQLGERVWLHPSNIMGMRNCDMMGGFSEYVLVKDPVVNYDLWPLPDNISYDEACVIEPFGVGMHGKNTPSAIPGDNVVVYGAGSIGLFAISALVAKGIKPVVVDLVFGDYKRKLLEKMGTIICPPEADKFEFIKEHFGEAKRRTEGPALNVDVVIDCAGIPSIFEDFFKMGKSKSRLSIVGINMAAPPISMIALVTGNYSIWGSCSYDQADFEEVFDILANKKAPIEDIITHHYPFEQLPEAFIMAADKEKAIKVVVDME